MNVSGLNINNSGTYNLTLSSGNVFSGSATFNNSGALSKATGSGTDVFNVELNNSGTVSVQNGTLRLTGGGMSSGVFSASSGAMLVLGSGYNFTDGAIFSGLGTVQLDNGSQTTLAGTIINNGSIAFAGVGGATYLYLSGNVTLAGSGTISFDNSGNDYITTINGGDTLTIGANQTIQGGGYLGLGSTNIVNNGTLIANQSTPLIVDGGTFTNNGELQEVGSSELQLLGVNVMGGTLASVGNHIHPISSTFSNVTNNGGLILSNGTQNTLVGTMTNNGNIAFAGVGGATYLYLSGNVTLAGSGTISFDNSGNDYITTINGGDTLTIGANQTIQGGGYLGLGSTNIVNNGTLIANQSTPLIVDGGTFTNNGELQEVGSSELQLLGVNVMGGTLASVGNHIHPISSTFSGVTNNGGLILSNGTQNTLVGTMTNNGNIAFAGVGGATYLYLSGNVTLAGSGTISFDNSGNDYITTINGGDTLTIGANQTIQGGGNLGTGSTNFVNNGTLIANQSNPLTISGGTFSNSGELQELGNSQLQFSGVNFMGGTLASVGNHIHPISSTFSGVTNNGGLILSNGTQNTLVGTMTNNGNIAFAGVGGATYLYLSGNVTLAGSGTISFDNSGNDYITTINGGDTLTIGANQTIQGGGNLGTGSTNFVNNGTITANNAVPLTIDSGTSGLTNNGTISSTGGGVLAFNGNVNSSGAINVGTGAHDNRRKLHADRRQFSSRRRNGRNRATH